jgi:hypothetical protein
VIICEHFAIQELVDPATYERFGVGAWQFFTPGALLALDGLREHFGRPITVNNWHRRGPFQFRGFRPRSCATGAEYSQHRLGNGFDCDIQGVSAEEARQEILRHKNDQLLIHINCIEADVNWLHFDCRNIADRIRIVKP